MKISVAFSVKRFSTHNVCAVVMCNKFEQNVLIYYKSRNSSITVIFTAKFAIPQLYAILSSASPSIGTSNVTWDSSIP